MNIIPAWVRNDFREYPGCYYGFLAFGTLGAFCALVGLKDGNVPPLFVWAIFSLIFSGIIVADIKSSIIQLVGDFDNHNLWYKYASSKQRAQYDQLEWQLFWAGLAMYISLISFIISVILRCVFHIDIT